ncbi:MAG: proline--tRNA ligase [Candidatus Omnitrophica bacterium]|nr:proline--tRNA ligase [Candidatus Omnitrophota bacterium]
MRWTRALIPTLKEAPQDAEAKSHILMVRAGLIRKLTSGTYSYLPLGLRVLDKVKKIIRDEMNKKGAQEVLLPAIQPPELWRQTGRYDLLGDVLIKFKDRHDKECVLGPTHEEIITSLVAGEVKSYKQLPQILYQIQTKFRDEPRPRFGILRSKEFIMKDAYSFDRDLEGLDKSYAKMYEAYCSIFSRCGLDYIPVEADPGFMGGNVSHEFMVPSEVGEDLIVICDSCGYSASREVAAIKDHRPLTIDHRPKTQLASLKEVDTPGVTTIEKVSALLKFPAEKMVKTLIYKADGQPVAVLVRGDHEVNEAKLKKYLKCEILELADEGTIKSVTGGPLGFSGPVDLKGTRIAADYSVSTMTDFITGANKKDKHLINVNLSRDFQVEEWADLRYITPDDMCPRCGKQIKLKTAIEVGHTFKLGTKYSKPLGAAYLDEQGREQPMIMGCYGIGVNRIAAAAIEQNNDENGIIWPVSISPFKVVIIPVNSADKKLMDMAEEIYAVLDKRYVEVILDDRDDRAGVKFKDADLIGFTYQIIVSDRHFEAKKVEIKDRRTGNRVIVPADSVLDHIKLF